MSINLKNFNRITARLSKEVEGLKSDIQNVECEIERQVGIIAAAEYARKDLQISKIAVANLREQLLSITG